MEFRRLHNNELNQWFKLCHTAFNVAETYFRRHFYSDPKRNTDGIFVAVDNKELVGTVRVFEREIYYHGQPVKMGGVGEVCTLASHYRQGIAKTLLTMAIDYMTSNDFKVSVLGSGADKLYEALGYKSRERLYKLLELKAKDNDYCFESIEHDDYSRLAKLYHKVSVKLDGPMVRSLEYFQTWFKEESSNYESFKIMKDQALLGYLVYSIKDDINLHELILEDINMSDEVLEHLLFHLSSDKPIHIPAIYPSKHKVIENINYKHWMYLNLTHKDYTDLNNHVIWKIDHY
ncbi:GNAT family N-acetyltransferase [Acidaminobacter sp. JC074]|uniref:GNAT family N-acetyltransferase n=1 Tax=Acidaminobacter sp. JC074 TaxID=2530199 RepID=UPI001F10EFEC|nr:GNAT family N-acetyltransferase [Acidaminobacter sp. JC074]MCH4888504.1 GNAT family N-acetyltransferase [Acidaminobacter sp. JC074]